MLEASSTFFFCRSSNAASQRRRQCGAASDKCPLSAESADLQLIQRTFCNIVIMNQMLLESKVRCGT